MNVREDQSFLRDIIHNNIRCCLLPLLDYNVSEWGLWDRKPENNTLMMPDDTKDLIWVVETLLTHTHILYSRAITYSRRSPTTQCRCWAAKRRFRMFWCAAVCQPQPRRSLEQCAHYASESASDYLERNDAASHLFCPIILIQFRVKWWQSND